MSRVLTEAVPATFVAAAFYNIAPIVEASAGRRYEEGSGIGLGLLVRLARDPVWLVGFACEIGGFAFEVIALTLAPLLLVQPLLASGLVLLVLGSGLFLGERLTRLGAAGMVTLSAGVVLLTVAVGPEPPGAVLPDAEALVFTVAAAGALTALLAYLAGRSLGTGHTVEAGALFGAAAGVCYTVAAVATRYVGVQVHRFGGGFVSHVMAGPGPYLLAAASVVATALLQRAMQSGSTLAAIPTSTSVAAVLPVPAGIFLFQENVPAGGRFVAFVAALVLTLAGASALGSQRGVVKILSA